MKMLFILLLSGLILSGCSIFTSSKRLDMTPFSDNTGMLFNEATKISRRYTWKYLKPYTAIPEYQQLYADAVPLILSLYNFAYYSNQVVAINKSKLSERKKNEQLVRYLSESMESAIADQRVDSLQLDKMGAFKIMNNIRNAKTYLDGIAEAEPIVNSAVRTTKNSIDKLRNQIAVFDREIELDYAKVKRNYLRLQNLQEKLVLSVTRLYLVRMGDKSELDTLLQEDASLRKFIPSVEKVSLPQLSSAEDHLIHQLEKIDKIINQLDDLKKEYLLKKDELNRWHSQADEKLSIAQTSITIWAQSHRSLGAGIPVPPLIDVGSIASSLAGSAAKAVVP